MFWREGTHLLPGTLSFLPHSSLFSTLTTPLFFHASVILFSSLRSSSDVPLSKQKWTLASRRDFDLLKEEGRPFAPPPLTPLAFSTHPLHPSQSILLPRHIIVSSFQFLFELERTCVLRRTARSLDAMGRLDPALWLPMSRSDLQ